MNYKEIKTSEDECYFIYKGKKLFERDFKKVLKFHSEGIAPVCDETGWYHLKTNGKEVYRQRYKRTFGYYFGKASVVSEKTWFHINIKGERIYKSNYAWCGNFQEDICTVRDLDNNYFHINNIGERIYNDDYTYVGDFKDGYACVRMKDGKFKHINSVGENLNEKTFNDLGVFHKSFATAKDEKGWFHINKLGEQQYEERYLLVEPFYNGVAIIETKLKEKGLINEIGDLIQML